MANTRHRCPTCGSSVTLVGGGRLVRRHLNPHVLPDRPRPDRLCIASGKGLDEAPLRVPDHWARPARFPWGEGDVCAECPEPIRPNAHGVMRHTYEFKGNTP